MIKEKDYKEELISLKNRQQLFMLLSNILKIPFNTMKEMVIDDLKIINDPDIAVKKRRPYCTIITLNEWIVVIFINKKFKDSIKKENEEILKSIYTKYPDNRIIWLNINKF